MHLAQRRALRTLTIDSAEKFKTPVVQTMFTQTVFIRTKRLPNENICANIIPTIRVELTTHRKCSQLTRTCLQRNIRSCRDGEFCDG